MTNILVIDDDQSICTVFERVLSSAGYTVETAANGRMGLRKLNEKPFDLVVCDIMMPETDGLEVIMAIRSEHLDIPVVAVSGGMQAATMDFLPLARKLGACKVLYKPVELTTLLSTIADALIDTALVSRNDKASGKPGGADALRDCA